MARETYIENERVIIDGSFKCIDKLDAMTYHYREDNRGLFGLYLDQELNEYFYRFRGGENIPMDAVVYRDSDDVIHIEFDGKHLLYNLKEVKVNLGGK